MNAMRSTLCAVAVFAISGCGIEAELRDLLEAAQESRGIGANGKICRPTGCSGQICSDEDVLTACAWRPDDACYGDATCERQADGRCGWTEDDALRNCLGQAVDGGTPDLGTVEPEPPGECHRGGCSGQLCTDRDDVVTTCEWRPEYACYQQATCERQADGQCGFTQDEALTSCLASAE